MLPNHIQDCSGQHILASTSGIKAACIFRHAVDDHADLTALAGYDGASAGQTQ